MTVSTTTNAVSYTAGGGAGDTTFAFTFKIFEKSDLYVYDDGALKTLDVDYTIPGVVPLTSGNVVFAVAPTAGHIIDIIRVLAVTQLTDYVEGDPFAAETHENALDRIIMILQQLQSHLIIKLPNDATPSVAGGNTFRTGGITTITDFDDGHEGQVIIIVSEHAITITDGTNIYLNGSVNFVMKATDTLTLIQKVDGKWYEVSRSVN